MSFGKRLKALRLKEKQSLQDVATAVAASKAHIWELERGSSKNPSLDLLRRLAQHFKVTVGYFVETEQLDDSKAQRFFQKNAAKLAKLSGSDIALLEKTIDALSRRYEDKD